MISMLPRLNHCMFENSLSRKVNKGIKLITGSTQRRILFVRNDNTTKQQQIPSGR